MTTRRTDFNSQLYKMIQFSWIIFALNGCEGTQTTALGSFPIQSAPVLTGPLYGGITSVTSVGYTTAAVNFPVVSYAQTVQINCYPRRSGVNFVTLATAPSTSGSALLTNLHSGTTYVCQANAIAADGTVSASTTTSTFQTLSYSQAGYQGVSLVQAYGPAPTAPAGTPNTAQVNLVWPNFPNAGLVSSTGYVVVRTNRGNTLDMTVAAACMPTSTGTCMVSCTSPIPNSCLDTQVGIAPQQYDYAVTMMPNGWVEELPATNELPYHVSVPVPPANMILVQRDSANYEMCNVMGMSGSSPVGPDPMNHQRCQYGSSGVPAKGDVPINSGPGKPALNLPHGFFDFGYNLFVDRFPAGCNWTTSGNTNPAFGAADKAVYYNALSGICWVNIGAGTNWITMNSAAGTSYLATAYTITPSTSNQRPPIAGLSQIQASTVCSSVSAGTYGSKRLLRHREFVAAAAWPWLSNDPNQMSTSAVASMEYGSGHTPGNYTCNSDNHAGFSLPASFTPSSPLSGVSGAGAKPNPASFVIGSLQTSQCVSRYGAQDLIGNTWQWVSDQVFAGSVTRGDLIGGVSNLDSGNDLTSMTRAIGYTIRGSVSYTFIFATSGFPSSGGLTVPFGFVLPGTDPDVANGFAPMNPPMLGPSALVGDTDCNNSSLGTIRRGEMVGGEALYSSANPPGSSPPSFDYLNHGPSGRYSIAVNTDPSGNQDTWGYPYPMGLGFANTGFRCAVSAD